MIKLQQKNLKIEQTYICLNPFCHKKQTRKFNHDHSHFISEFCKKWIINQDQFFKLQQNYKFSSKQIYNLQLNFQDAPFKALSNLYKLKLSNWQALLQNQQNKIKKQLNKIIQKQYQLIKININELINKSNYLIEIKDIIFIGENNIDQQLNQYIDLHYNIIAGLNNYKIFNKVQIKENVDQIKANIQKLAESFLSQKNVVNQLLSNEEKRKFHQFMFQHTPEYYNKFQSIASSLNKLPSKYTFQHQNLSLDCFLCHRKAHSLVNPQNKKQIKKFLAQQILVHLYCNHYQEVGFAYCKKIAKTQIMALTFQQFISFAKKYECINLIDRQSGVIFQQKYQDLSKSPLTYTIQIISTKNIGMAKGKYILVQNNESVDSLIAIISYLCTKQDQNINIITNKPSLKKGLQSLLWCKIDKTNLNKQKQNKNNKRQQ